MSRRIRVVPADDEPFIRSGWATMLSLYKDIEVIGEAADGHAAVGLGRAGAAGYVLKRSPAADLVTAIRLRDGVLFPDALRRIAAPRPRAAAHDLTPRELDVLRHLARGLSNAEIAAALYVTRETVKTHVGNVLDQLGARDRTQAVVRAYDLGLVLAGD
ncbi:response regulator transcription factor [Nonomuraea sp. NPDC050451]|uniref:response regulator transcription factor n=1 Tax=Nonomuraea sp. NPDC050451 TaxID=3364364 RepID=UPI0037A422B5